MVNETLSTEGLTLASSGSRRGDRGCYAAGFPMHRRTLEVTTPRIAVVGSGPAGLGVVTAVLEAAPRAEITLFEIGRPLARPAFEGEPGAARIAAHYERIYRGIWRGQRRAFPPPKTHFGETLPKFPVDGRPKIFRSDTLGGLSNFWGGTSLPFTDRELAGWPVRRADLDPHYRRVAEVIGISGRPDGLNRYFGADFSNRPPIYLPPAFERMQAAWQEAPPGAEFEIVAGVNRCAVETRDHRPNACVRCGECLTGCFRDAIFSTRQAFAHMIEASQTRLVSGEVRAFDPRTRTLEVKAGGTLERFGPYDRVYLAAGCPGTTAIALRSLGLDRTLEMSDNAVYVFPILRLGGAGGDAGRDGRPPGSDPHLSLSNLLVGLVPRGGDLPYAQVQVYPNFDYMWRYNLPPPLWPLVRGWVRGSRSRLFWARLYVHGRLSQAYEVAMEGDELRFSYARGADTAAARRMMRALRPALSRGGFWVPPLQPVHQNANSHYGATLPWGGDRVPVAESGEIAPGVYVCDSSVFPDLPAVSLTFTLMACAHRTATRSL